MYLQSVIKQQSVAMVKEGTSVIGDILGSQVNLLDFHWSLLTENSQIIKHRNLRVKLTPNQFEILIIVLEKLAYVINSQSLESNCLKLGT